MMKKAIELSLNFLVTVILALVIFGFGIRFINNLASDVDKLKDFTFDELDKQVEDLLCESTDKVCLGTTKKVIQKGDFDVFGVKIINVISDSGFDDNFKVNLEVSKLIKKNNEEVTADLDELIEVKYRDDLIKIQKNEEDDIGIGIEVKKGAPSGTYILDVWVEPYLSRNDITLQKIYVEVP